MTTHERDQATRINKGDVFVAGLIFPLLKVQMVQHVFVAHPLFFLLHKT